MDTTAQEGWLLRALLTWGDGGGEVRALEALSSTAGALERLTAQSPACGCGTALKSIFLAEMSKPSIYRFTLQELLTH